MNDLRVVFPRDGEILSRHDGRETADGLEVRVRGACSGEVAVTVNGRPAARDGADFEVPVLLSAKKSVIHIEAGTDAADLGVLYDRNSFPRYRLSLDDNIWFLTEIARHSDRYPSLFDHWYLGFFKELHETFGTRVQANIYFEDPEVGFDLTQFPDKYKSEWEDNASWLLLSFHALGNNCYANRIYRDASYEQTRRDYEKVTAEIVRFAGESVLCDTYTTVHWADTSKDAGRAFRDVGIRGLTGRFGVRADGTGWETRYYLDNEANILFGDRNMFFDPELGLYFVNTPRFLNNVPLDEIGPHYEGLVKGAADRAPWDVIDFLVHEEHFWRGCSYYKSDNMERCRQAIRLVTDLGLQPVSFAEGIAGNTGTGGA